MTLMTPDRRGPRVPSSQPLPALASALLPSRASPSQDQRGSQAARDPQLCPLKLDWACLTAI